MGSGEPSPYIQVMLVEQEAETVSVASLYLSEIKECRLEVCSSAQEAWLKIPDKNPDLILFTHDLYGANGFEVLTELHQKYPSIYVIVSLPEGTHNLAASYMKVGAIDCVYKDKNYVSNLLTSVKRALIRIADRESFELPALQRAEQLAIEENLPDLIFVLNADGDFIYVNRAATQLLGYEPKDLIGKQFSILVGSDFKTWFEKEFHSILKMTHFRDLIPIQNKSGEEQLFEVNCSLLEENIQGVARLVKPYDLSGDSIEITTLAPESEIGRAHV